MKRERDQMVEVLLRTKKNRREDSSSSSSSSKTSQSQTIEGKRVPRAEKVSSKRSQTMRIRTKY